jgi:hypothetical protein
MRSVWSLTKLVVRESIRKRLLILLGMTIGVILVVPLLLPSADPGETLRIAQSWLLSCITFFGVVAALFIAGTSLPGDFREGRLFLLFTKPVHRSTYVLSKFLGFTLVFLIFTVIVGGAGYAILLFLAPGRGPDALSAREKLSSDVFKFNQVRNENQSTFRGGVTEEDGSERILVYGSSTTAPIAMWEFQRPQEAVYNGPPTALLDFEGRGPRGEYSIKLRFYVKIPVEMENENRSGTTVRWRRVQREVKNLSQSQIGRFTVLPDRYRDSKGLDSVFDDVERVRVVMTLANPAAYVSFHRDSVQISGPNEPYLYNYMKALFMIFLLLVYLSAFLTAVTPVLSGPVSICLGLLFYMVGSMTTFLEDAITVTRSTIRNRQSGIAHSAGHGHVPNPDIPTWALEYSSFVIESVMTVVPDFTQFSQQALLMQGWEIPMSTLYGGLQVTVPAILFFLVVGTLLFQVREISS